MTEHVRRTWRHCLGLLLAVSATAVLVAVWVYGLDYLVGSIFEELRYIVFAVVAVGFLSALNALLVKWM